MSGIEMSLWLVERIWGDATLKRVKNYIAYGYPETGSVSDRD